MEFKKYPKLNNFPAQDDTVLVYDASSGNIKQVEHQNIIGVTVDRRQVFVQSSQPTDAESSVGDLWIDIT